jgi:hypothetical protein
MLLPGVVMAQQAADRDEAEARSWVEAVAATVYAAAWPTATYESFRLRDVDRLADGLAASVRLSGESGFGGNLWVDLAFTFRHGQLFDMEVEAHNAVLVPPFETTKTLAAATMEFAQDFAQRQAARREAAASASAAAADVVDFAMVPGDDRTLHLAMYVNGVPRVLDQPFDRDTRVGWSELVTIGGMPIVSFEASDPEWQVQYWWHLETDELYFAARNRNGRLATSENFDTARGTVGERMRRLVLDPWLRSR